MVAAVEVENLTVQFESVTALKDVTHTFEPGTATAVMGVNGSGKTTMLECLGGLQRPTSGRISGVSDNLAYVCQHLPACWMPITAGEVLAMGRYRHRGLVGRLRSNDRAAMADAAEQLDVTPLLSRSFGDLSGGQQQRVRIAQALSAEPEVMMLDEPVAGLDIPSQDRILNMIEEYSSRGAIVIITTHHVDEAWHCDTVMLMANRLVGSGPARKMLTQERLREAFGARLGDHAGHDHDQSLILLEGHDYHGHDQGGHSGHDHQGRDHHGHGHSHGHSHGHDHSHRGHHHQHGQHGHQGHGPHAH